MEIHLRFTLLIHCVCLLWISGLASVPSKDFLGIAPEDETYYKSSVIKCKDGSKKFTREQLNDQFCDCPDGSDEPGTSACPEGKFYCRNLGHIPQTIFSSRVNDGICDCCDGSDEYHGNLNCQNTCWEAGKAARNKLKKKIETYKEGVIVRNQEVEKAKQAFAKDEADLSKLKSEEKILKDLVQKLKEHKERIEKAEEEERLKKEKEEKRLKEAENITGSQESSHGSTDGVHDKDSDLPEQYQGTLKDSHDTAVEQENVHNAGTEISSSDGLEQRVAEDQDDQSETGYDSKVPEASSTDVARQHVVDGQDDTLLKASTDDDSGSREAAPTRDVEEDTEGSEGTKGLSREELGRLVASRWTGEDAAQKTNEAGSTEKGETHEDNLNSAQEEDYNGYSSETEDDRHKYDDDDFEDDLDEEDVGDPVEPNGSHNPDEDDKTDFSDFTDSSSPSWLSKIQQTVQNVLQAFKFFKTPVDLSEADHVRKEYADSNSKLSKIQSRISSLNDKLKHDYGKEKEFYSFYDNCFETKQNKYVYKVCPFKQASQVEGHSTTRLGEWEKFDESYRVMEFSKGDKCWNGPDRSLKVRLRCGLKNELTDVDEPSRCEYVALLSTPAICLEEKLKELQQKLEQMNARQPQSHDEL